MVRRLAPRAAIVSRVVELLQILVTCDAVEQGGMGLCGRALARSHVQSLVPCHCTRYSWIER